MLLYIHVPFCRARCAYCSFFSLPLGKSGENDRDVQRYAQTALAEIALWGERLGSVPVRTVFFGGGTPSILPVKVIEAMLTRIHRCFSVDKDAEISFEANPESFAVPDYARDLRATGVTRLSLGVQSLDDTILQRMGRLHSAQPAIAAYKLARRAGFSSINLDFIWGFPGQRISGWLNTLGSAASLQADHLSCYGLSVEKDTAMATRIAGGEMALPAEQEQAKMYIYGSEYLESEGYVQYEISNYARVGYECLHNKGYWNGRDYLGIGPSATSTLGERRWTNPLSLDLWEAQVQAKQVGQGYHALTKVEQLQEFVMLHLRMAKGVPLDEYKQLAGYGLFKANLKFIKALYRQGLIRLRNRHLALTRNGMLVSTLILERLLEEVKNRGEQ